jgi:uncharacterized membrane protein YvlD (DUF360 family)
VCAVLFLLTLPLTLVTLGLFIFVLNAVCLGLTAALVPGFAIFWSALFGAIVISVASWILNDLLIPRERACIVNCQCVSLCPRNTHLPNR